MKKIYLVNESLDEFAGRRGRPRKNAPRRAPKAIADEFGDEPEDNWYAADDEFDADDGPGPEQIEDVELEDEVTDIAIQKQIQKRLENELASPEFNRVSVKFRSPTGVDQGIPMAKMGDAFLLKLKNGGMKKIVLKINSTKELIEKFQEVKDAGLPTALITDAGRTQIPAGSKTAFACGPIEENEAEKYFSELKLL